MPNREEKRKKGTGDIGKVDIESGNDKSNSKKPYRHGKPNPRKVMDEKHNDAVFFSRNPQLTKDTTNLPFSFKNGLVTDGPVKTNSVLTVNNKFHVPSVICFNFDMLLGGNKDKNSLNTIANNLYSYIRYANSGSRNYESPDLFMYFGATSGLYGLAAFIAKCIGLLNVASPINRAYPKQVLAAMRINYGDAIDNIANYRARLNSCIIRLNAYNVPAQFYCYLEHIWCSSILYIESDNGKDQIYTSRPLGILQFDGTTSQSGSSLKYKSLEAATTLDDFLDAFETLLTALETDEDIGIISGDVLKAMGNENCFHMGTVAEDYVALPTYSKEMLLKLKNIRLPVATINANRVHKVPTVFGHKANTPSGWEVATANDALIYWQISNANLANQIEVNYGLGSSDSELQACLTCDSLLSSIIDSDSDTPTQDEINENVCFKFGYGGGFGSANYSGYEVKVFGLAIFRSITISRYSNALGYWIVDDNFSNVMLANIADQGSQLYVITKLHDVVTFDYMMACYAAYALNGSGQPSGNLAFRYMGEYTNVHLLTDDELDNIIDAQLLSEFAIPANQHLGAATAYNK